MTRHGKNSSYQMGCRCVSCTHAHRRSQRDKLLERIVEEIINMAAGPLAKKVLINEFERMYK